MSSLFVYFWWHTTECQWQFNYLFGTCVLSEKGTFWIEIDVKKSAYDTPACSALYRRTLLLRYLSFCIRLMRLLINMGLVSYFYLTPFSSYLFSNLVDLRETYCIHIYLLYIKKRTSRKFWKVHKKLIASRNR